MRGKGGDYAQIVSSQGGVIMRKKGGRLCVDKIQNQQGFPQLCKAIT